MKTNDPLSKVKLSKQCVAVRSNLALPLRGNSHAIWDHSVTCHPTEVRIPPLPPAEAGTQFSDPRGMQR